MISLFCKGAYGDVLPVGYKRPYKGVIKAGVMKLRYNFYNTVTFSIIFSTNSSKLVCDIGTKGEKNICFHLKSVDFHFSFFRSQKKKTFYEKFERAVDSNVTKMYWFLEKFPAN